MAMLPCVSDPSNSRPGPEPRPQICSGKPPIFHGISRLNPGISRLGPTNDRSYRKCAGEDGWGANECGGRRTFDKTVSRKPLAFAADAAAMGIDRCFGTLAPGLHGRVRQANWRCANHRVDATPRAASKQGNVQHRCGLLPLCATRSVRHASGLLETPFRFQMAWNDV